MGTVANNGYNNRWYDKYSELGVLLGKLQELKKSDRDRIILELKDMINGRDKCLFDKYVYEFPMPSRRRWYDQNPFSWLVISALKYADEDLITDIILYLKERL